MLKYENKLARVSMYHSKLDIDWPTPKLLKNGTSCREPISLGYVINSRLQKATCIFPQMLPSNIHIHYTVLVHVKKTTMQQS